jgi:hypothetical protein
VESPKRRCDQVVWCRAGLQPRRRAGPEGRPTPSTAFAARSSSRRVRRAKAAGNTASGFLDVAADGPDGFFRRADNLIVPAFVLETRVVRHPANAFLDPAFDLLRSSLDFSLVRHTGLPVFHSIAAGTR